MAEGYKDWSAGEILTAADLEDYTVKQSVMRFADSSARTTALSGVLAEGMVSYLKDTDTIEVYDGSAWNAVGTAGLVLISRTTIGSAVSSVTVSSAFSSDYDNYRIIVSGGSSSASSDMYMTLGATVTGYYFAGKLRFYAGSDANPDEQNFTKWFIGSNGASNAMALDVMVLGPNLATETAFGAQIRAMNTTGAAGYVGGFLNDTTQYTDFTIEPSTGTLTGGNIDVYGLVKA